MTETAPAAAPLILHTLDQGVAILTLNNPRKRNILSRAMLADLEARLREAEADPSVRALIVAHEGPVFSSGHNMSDLVGAGEGDAAELFETSAGLMEYIRLMSKPVIGQIAGLASAAGCQLAASCDLIVAADTASFQTPGVMIGLFCSTPMVPLSRAVPPKKAMEMLLTGHPVSAAEAERMGLVNRVVPPERLAAETLALARDITRYSAHTLALGKQAFYRQLPLPVGEAYRVAREAMTRNSQTEDAQEGMSAFLEKRPPKFRH